MQHDDLPLFAWADARPSAVVIDAVHRFQGRTAQFVAELLGGRKFPISGGVAPVILDEVRRRRAQSRDDGRAA